MWMILHMTLLPQKCHQYMYVFMWLLPPQFFLQSTFRPSHSSIFPPLHFVLILTIKSSYFHNLQSFAKKHTSWLHNYFSMLCIFCLFTHPSHIFLRHRCFVFLMLSLTTLLSLLHYSPSLYRPFIPCSFSFRILLVVLSFTIFLPLFPSLPLSLCLSRLGNHPAHVSG